MVCSRVHVWVSRYRALFNSRWLVSTATQFSGSKWSRLGLFASTTLIGASVAIMSQELLSDCSAASKVDVSVSVDVSEAVVRLRPNSAEYTRIDDVYLTPELAENHAIHDTLMGDGMVEAYEIYKHNSKNEVYCVIKYGHALNGHKGVVHGGITSLLFDNSFGWLFISSKKPKSVTANLNINYRNPIFAGSVVVLKAQIEREEGRKLYMNATMESETGQMLADSTTLFIALKKRE